MRKILLATAALIAVSTAVHAKPISLPEAMLGDWCFDEGKDSYIVMDPVKKCDDSFLVVKTDGYETIEANCTFDKIEQTARNIYVVHVKCIPAAYEIGDDLEERTWTEYQEFRILDKNQVFDKELKITILNEG
jgi:hypothetical protein